jgi:hypothetical protein
MTHAEHLTATYAEHLEFEIDQHDEPARTMYRFIRAIDDHLTDSNEGTTADLARIVGAAIPSLSSTLLDTYAAMVERAEDKAKYDQHKAGLARNGYITAVFAQILEVGFHKPANIHLDNGDVLYNTHILEIRTTCGPTVAAVILDVEDERIIPLSDITVVTTTE